MYSNEELERFYFRYQAEALPHGTSLQTFCLANKVPYNIFSKWYKDTRRKIVEVQVQGRPSSDVSHEEHSVRKVEVRREAVLSLADAASNNLETATSQVPSSQVSIRLELHFSNGLYVSRKNLNYRQLRDMVEKLEGLC